MNKIKTYTGYAIIFLAIALGIYAFAYPESWVVQRFDHIATMLLALLTAAYVFFTYKILDATRPRPHVFVSLPSEQMNIFLSLKSVGSRPAYDVKIEIDPSLDIIAPTDAFKGASTSMLKQSFLAPNTELRNFVSTSLQVLSNKGVRQSSQSRSLTETTNSASTPMLMRSTWLPTCIRSGS